MCDYTETFQMVQKLFQLQEERAHCIKIFEEGYKMYIANQPNCNLSKFRQLVNDSTKDFKRITNGFLEIAKKFRTIGFDHLADSVLSLQKAEENRLQLSAKLQLAKQDAFDNPEILTSWNKVAQIKEMYIDSIKLIDDKMEKLRLETNEIIY